MGIEDTDLQPIKDDGKVETAMKGAGLFFFVLLLIELPVSLAISIVQDQFDAQYATLISVLMTQGYLLLAALLYIKVTHKKFGADLQVKRYKISSFFLSLLMLIVASPMASWLNVLSQLFAKNETSGAIYDITQNVPMWLAVLIIGCLPGFVEETIYRGILFSVFRKRSVLTGVIISGLSFGLMHMNFNQILYAIYLGIVFALLVEATGSLVSTMILHMLFNALNTSYLYLLPKLYEILGSVSSQYANFDIEAELAKTPERGTLYTMLEALAPMAAIGVVLMILILKAIAKINGRDLSWKYLCSKREENGKPINMWIILGWIFCLVFAFLNLLGG
ncbi:MAG: CPBP family intramembrane metalloprotease [Clostridiales bacterium]|nr:CPBP family intramembrane metalloprotease [Clostridiales bacterium]